MSFENRRRRRSIAIGLLLGLLVALFYIIAFIKMGQQMPTADPGPGAR